MTVTDVQPRVCMCPLPKGYWWEVELLQALNSVHVSLMKRRNIGPVTSSCAVLNFSSTSTDRAVTEIINRSYEMWQNYFRSSHEKNDVWQARADELTARLQHPGVNVKVRLKKVK